jgi:hypothetical protein
MTTADQTERNINVGRTPTSRTVPPSSGSNGAGGFALPFADLNDPTKNAPLGAVNPNIKWEDIYSASQSQGGTPQDIWYRALGGMFSGNAASPSNTPPATSGGGTGKKKANPLMDALAGYAGNISGSDASAMARLKQMYDQLTGEVNTQADAGRTTINDTTQQTLDALNAQANPYANLRMMDMPAVSDPMAAYSQAVGAPTGGIDALQQMLQSQNSAVGGGFNNLAQLLGASHTAQQQSRIADVNSARTGAQQDLATSQRTANLGALQQMLSGQQGQQSATQGRQDTLAQQLLGLAGAGVDVSKIMAMLGGQ